MWKINRPSNSSGYQSVYCEQIAYYTDTLLLMMICVRIMSLLNYQCSVHCPASGGAAAIGDWMALQFGRAELLRRIECAHTEYCTVRSRCWCAIWNKDSGWQMFQSTRYSQIHSSWRLVGRPWGSVNSPLIHRSIDRFNAFLPNYYN